MNSYTSNSKRFCIAFILIFMVGNILFVIGSEFIVRTVAMPKSQFDALRERLHSSQHAYGAFADSRGANGLLPFNDFDNFSMGGDNLLTVLEKAKFFNRLGTTKGVIIQADPHHFANYRLNRDQSSLQDDLLKRKTYWLQFLRPVHRQYLLEYWQSYILAAFSATESPDSSATHVMARISDQPPAQVKKDASIRAQLQIPIKMFERTQYAKDYSATVQELVSDNIKVCLVSFPVSDAYRAISETEPNYRAAFSFFKTLAKHSGAKYFDFSSKLPDKMFTDPDHLNEEGAQALTNIVLNNCFGITP